VCSESGLPDDLSWGRLGYIRWLDTAQDLCHSKATHPLDHTDFTLEPVHQPVWPAVETIRHLREVVRLPRQLLSTA